MGMSDGQVPRRIILAFSVCSLSEAIDDDSHTGTPSPHDQAPDTAPPPVQRRTPSEGRQARTSEPHVRHAPTRQTRRPRSASTTTLNHEVPTGVPDHLSGSSFLRVEM